MPELAAMDGMPPPADLPRGDCVVTTLYGEDGSETGIRIDQADPRVLISEALLATVADDPPPYARLDRQCTLPAMGRWGITIGDLLKIQGVNRTVIYRLAEYVPRVHAYIGEWPD
jgi:hypothetical protein